MWNYEIRKDEAKAKGKPQLAMYFPCRKISKLSVCMIEPRQLWFRPGTRARVLHIAPDAMHNFW